MADLDTDNLSRLFAAVGARLSQPADLYVLGGGALVLLGSPRRTRDLDIVGSDIPAQQPSRPLQTVLEQAAREMKIGVDPIPFDEFIPLPSEAETRHRLVGHYGNLTVYVFDPYSIALSKIERGLKTDIEDVAFMLRRKIIQLDRLDDMAEAMLPRGREFDLDAEQIRTNLKLLRVRRK